LNLSSPHPPFGHLLLKEKDLLNRIVESFEPTAGSTAKLILEPTEGSSAKLILEPTEGSSAKLIFEPTEGS
jgi:hypothetical protein